MSRKSAIILFLLAVAMGAAFYGWQYSHRVPPLETIASVEAKLRKDPQNVSLHEQLARLMVAAGQLDGAAEHFQTAMRIAPDKASARCGLAGILVTRGQILDAQKLLETNLKLSPRDPATNELLGDILMRTLGEKTPDIAYPLAASYFDVALQGDPTREVAALGLSKIFLAAGKLSDAAGALQKAVEAHPKSAGLHLQKARVLALAQRYDQAGKEYNLGTALDPKNSAAYMEWGIMLIDAARPATAENALRIAEQLDPKNPQIHMHLGRALRDLGQSIGAAMDEFAKAIDCDRTYGPVYVEIANTLLRVHDDTNIERAQKFLEDAVLVAPTYTPAKLELVRLILNRPGRSQKDLYRVAELLGACVEETKERDISVLVAYADVLANLQLYDRAVEQMEKAIAWGSSHGLRPDAMELLYTRRQNYQAAQMPHEEGGGPDFIAIEGRHIHDPVDDPWPFPQQPTVESILMMPADLTRVPEPGTLLDPKNYVGEAVRKRGNTPSFIQGY